MDLTRLPFRQARPRLFQRSPSRKGTRTLRTPRRHSTKETSQPFPRDAAYGRDNLRAQMALKVTLPPETRPGVRVDQATARLTRAQKLKAELKEKLLEVKQAVQDNLTEIAAATAELENAKRALIPSAPTTNLGSACITFNREQSAELQGFLLSCQESMAIDPEDKERTKRRCDGAATKATRPLESPRKPHRRR